MDTIIIAIYFVFMIGVGIAMHRLNAAPSDYFRAGGAAPWWLCGCSALMTSFSAWSFTGAAGRIYADGFAPLALYGANVVAFLVCWLWFAARYRQMRVITYVDAIVRRYGTNTGQFYVWIQLVFGIFSGAVMLNGLAVFLSVAFGLSISVTILVVGAAVTVAAIIGGAWAVLASDFVQLLIIVAVSVTSFILVLMDDRIGGLGGLFAQLPERFFNPTESTAPTIFYLWIAALLLNQVIALNNMGEASARFLPAADSRAARRAALIPAIGILVGPILWAVPALAATVFTPDLATAYPGMKTPSEAAFVASARAVLPAGFMGLLVCGMFAATMSSMDTALNRAAGLIVMNIYAPLRRFRDSDVSLVKTGKVVTCLLGILVTLGGLYFSQWRTLGLFDFVIRMTSIVVLPLAVPMFFGLFLRPLPRGIAIWSAAAGMTTSLALLFWLPADKTAALFGLDRVLTSREWTDAGYALTVFATTTISSLVIVGGFLWKRRQGLGEPEPEEFFRDIETPVLVDVDRSRAGSRIIGNCSILYGIFVASLAAMPNSPTGHLAFLGCGTFILIIGYFIRRSGRIIPKEATL